MGVGHVPQEPVRAEGQGAHVQGRERGGAPAPRPVDLTGVPTRQADRRNVARGRWGEDEAARWYAAHGYDVVARNWRCDVGEIDLIVVRDRTTVFVEVKARADDRYGPASAAVGAAKQRTIRRVAARWLSDRGAAGRGELRFDVVAVTGARVEVIESAF